MANLIYIESSPRKDRSHSIKVANAFLAEYKKTNPNDHVDVLDLWGEKLPAFDGDMINAKYAVMHGADQSSGETAAWGQVQKIFDRFNAADKYLFSVPMWNFGIPYILKHYIDIITQPGMAWSFDPAAGYSGLVTGRAAVIYSSAGVYHEGSGAEAFDNQRPYFQGWLGFVGITDVTPISCAPMLGAPEDVEKAVSEAIIAAQELAARF
ncbi:MAG: FMN-dependent NADH-azoreductase [Gammaproteobacteria bacterium]|jgi:FMN-dependent NADH-azoreductase